MTSSRTQKVTRRYSAGCLELINDNSLKGPKRSLGLLDGIHAPVPFFSTRFCLTRFVEANGKVLLLVFDLADGLYSKTDDNTDTGHHKSKFVCSAHM